MILDINYVVCGIATTVAATVGYAYSKHFPSRRRQSSLGVIVEDKDKEIEEGEEGSESLQSAPSSPSAKSFSSSTTELNEDTSTSDVSDASGSESECDEGDPDPEPQPESYEDPNAMAKSVRFERARVPTPPSFPDGASTSTGGRISFSPSPDSDSPQTVLQTEQDAPVRATEEGVSESQPESANVDVDVNVNEEVVVDLYDHEVEARYEEEEEENIVLDYSLDAEETLNTTKTTINTELEPIIISPQPEAPLERDSTEAEATTAIPTAKSLKRKTPDDEHEEDAEGPNKRTCTPPQTPAPLQLLPLVEDSSTARLLTRKRKSRDDDEDEETAVDEERANKRRTPPRKSVQLPLIGPENSAPMPNSKEQGTGEQEQSLSATENKDPGQPSEHTQAQAADEMEITKSTPRKQGRGFGQGHVQAPSPTYSASASGWPGNNPNGNGHVGQTPTTSHPLFGSYGTTTNPFTPQPLFRPFSTATTTTTAGMATSTSMPIINPTTGRPLKGILKNPNNSSNSNSNGAFASYSNNGNKSIFGSLGLGLGSGGSIFGDGGPGGSLGENEEKKGLVERYRPAHGGVLSDVEIKPTTGEESETSLLELKNVSLHIKRGEREWGSGMVGGLKWLVGKDAKKDERLLFRRYPLQSVTMNVKLSSVVKVIFNENEGALRVILTENADPSESQSPEDSEEQEQEQEVVIYAMKPAKGRCSQKEFNQFAKAVKASSKL